MSKSRLHPITRRQFLIGAGATLAGAALACGRQPELVPTAPISTSLPAVPTLIPAQPAVPTASLESMADLVLRNGKVITVDAADTIAQAVAVKNGLVQAVGADEAMVALIGQTTQVIDLGGKAVTPGLIDAHNHLQVMGMTRNFFAPFMPPEVKSLDDLRKKLAEALTHKPKGEWLQGYFLTVSEGRLPNRQDLDPASPDHPVWLMQQGGHYGSANSLALKLAGITASTPSPEGGLIEKDAQGEPTGVFYNHRAMDMLRRVAPQQAAAEARQNITSSLPMFAACGVTSLHDNC